MLKQPVYSKTEASHNLHPGPVPPENADIKAIARVLGLPVGSGVADILAEIKKVTWPASATGNFNTPACEALWAKLGKFIDLAPCKKDETICPLTQVERVLKQTPIVNRHALLAVAGAIADGRIKPGDKQTQAAWLNRVTANPVEGGVLLNSSRQAGTSEPQAASQRFPAIVQVLQSAGVAKADAVLAAKENSPVEYNAWFAAGGSQF